MEMAETWVRNINYSMSQDGCCYWTICEKNSAKFLGSMGISIHREQEGGEIHYWINADEWNKGYCTEAAKCTISHFFEDLKLHRLAVTHREGNTASQVIIKKCGFVFEGSLRDYLKRFGNFENVFTYSMLRNEYLAMKKNGLY
jgi:RimJ/RimL family protein N-acetyltransferase